MLNFVYLHLNKIGDSYFDGNNFLNAILRVIGFVWVI